MSIKEQLQAPFPAADVEWRIGKSGVKDGKPWGLCLAYITARAVQDRLDAVVGPEGWRDHYTFITEAGGGVMCELSLRFGDEWVTKENGSDLTDIESFKGGISKALVRTASSWGIGRYLYDLGVTWAEFNDKGEHSAKIENNFYKWSAPKLPAWALPLPKLAGQNTSNPAAPKMTPPAGELLGAGSSSPDASPASSKPTPIHQRTTAPSTPPQPLAGTQTTAATGAATSTADAPNRHVLGKKILEACQDVGWNTKQLDTFMAARFKKGAKDLTIVEMQGVLHHLEGLAFAGAAQ